MVDRKQAGVIVPVHHAFHTNLSTVFAPDGAQTHLRHPGARRLEQVLRGFPP